MRLDFSIQGERQYSLTCMNQSSGDWYIYIFQTLVDQSTNEIYSLVWMASPYRIGNQSYVTFVWSENLAFVWLDTGILGTGVTPSSGGSLSASLESSNITAFEIVSETPQFSTPTQGSPSDMISIEVGNSVPNSVFSTGVGMSGFPIIVGQSYQNVTQNFGLDTTFWVAATTSKIVVSEVLIQQAVSNSTSFAFPPNVYGLTAILGSNNLWTIS